MLLFPTYDLFIHLLIYLRLYGKIKKKTEGAFTVSPTEKEFLSLYAFHVFKTEFKPQKEFDKDELFSLSGKHKVTPMILDALIKSGEYKRLPGTFIASFKCAATADVAMQTRSDSALFAFLSGLEKTGIRYGAVKGAVLSSLYPKPEYRLSQDADLLLRDEDLSKFDSYATDHGMVRANAGDGTVLKYSGCGLKIEVHIKLFPSSSPFTERLNRAMGDVLEKSAVHDINGITVHSLSHTDHLLYLFFHSLKHFIFCGFGIRQVSDFCLYATAFKDGIDGEAIIRKADEVGALLFLRGFLSLCRLTFGITPDDMGFHGITADVDCEDLLSDVISAGVYGNSSSVRLHSASITVSSANGRTRTARLRALFPSAISLKSRYPYLENRGYLLPVAWIQRIVSYVTRGETKRAEKVLELGQKRVEMMKRYGIVK